MDSMCGWCETVLSWIWDEFWSSVWRWARDTIRRCNRHRCRWICACCNRWLCWIVAVLVAILALILALILTIVAIVVCAICYIVCVAFCLLGGILFGNTEIDACIEAWCQGLPRESDEKPPDADPQRPGEPGPPGGVDPGGGVVRGSQAIVIANVAELNALERWRYTLGGPSHVVLRMPGISEKDSRHWQTLFNHHLSVCGCKEGASALGIAVFGYALWVTLSSARQPPLQSSTIYTALWVALVGGIVGKVFGVYRARTRLSRLIKQFETTVPHTK